MDEIKIEDALGYNQDIGSIRLKVCYKCPLFSLKYGGLCNNKLWLNVDTNETSLEPKTGYVNGCGCLLASKVKVAAASCPIDKW